MPIPMRPPARKREREEMVAYLHGIDPDGNLLHMFVRRKGSKVRFTGGLEHDVAAQNSLDLKNWANEAQSACGLTNVMGVHRGFAHTPEYVAKIELLKAIAETKKKELVDRR